MVLCNKKWYDSLSPEDQKAARDAAKAARASSRGLGILLDEVSLDKLRKKGMDVYLCSPSEVEEFQEMALPKCLAWLKEQMDPKWVDEFEERIRAAEAKLGY
jgi:TRAP-type C4-dicarboxylate transport system substrate-binding protein